MLLSELRVTQKTKNIVPQQLLSKTIVTQKLLISQKTTTIAIDGNEITKYCKIWVTINTDSNKKVLILLNNDYYQKKMVTRKLKLSSNQRCY